MEVMKVTAADLAPLIILRHNAIVLAMQQSFWDKYGIGKAKSKRVTKPMATVASGTSASSVVNDRLAAVRAMPIARMRATTRRTKKASATSRGSDGALARFTATGGRPTTRAPR